MGRRGIFLLSPVLVGALSLACSRETPAKLPPQVPETGLMAEVSALRSEVSELRAEIRALQESLSLQQATQPAKPAQVPVEPQKTEGDAAKGRDLRDPWK